MENKVLDKYKAILFDFDFTLCDSSKGQCESVNYALTKMGRDMTQEHDILRHVGHSLEDIFEKLTGNSDGENKKQFRTFFTERADEIMSTSVRMYPKVDSLLKQLHLRGKYVGIVSTKYRYRIEEILSNYGMYAYVNIIIGGEDVMNYKPDPEGVFLALNKLGVKPFEALYIGDSLVDAEVSLRSGLDFIAVLSGTTELIEFEQYRPLAILYEVHELLNY